MTDDQREILINEYTRLLIAAKTSRVKYLHLNVLTDLIKNRSPEQIAKMERMFK